MKVILFVSFVLLTFLSLPLLLYPIRRSTHYLGALGIFILMGLGMAYKHFGGYTLWQKYQFQLTQKEAIQTLLKQSDGPEQLIRDLKFRLQAFADDAQGWYLLGRLQASQGQWELAKDAYAKANELKPQDEMIAINYIQSLWELNHQQLNPTLIKMLKQILDNNSEQPDALAMLALEAFNQTDYAIAIGYWQKLIKLFPKDSEDAKAIRKAIAKARSKLI